MLRGMFQCQELMEFMTSLKASSIILAIVVIKCLLFVSTNCWFVAL
jgi:hypothetical protein